MANITSTTRPITSGSNITAPTTSNVGDIATESLTEDITETSSTPSNPYKTPGINDYRNTSEQQAIDATTINETKPNIVYRNTYLKDVSETPRINSTTNLSSSERSDLSIFSNWANKLKATNDSAYVTTYNGDKSTVPLIRRDTNDFFNVVYNQDGTYQLSTAGIRVPFTNTVVGKYDLGSYSWNPVTAWNMAAPIGTYLGNYKFYDTKNKIIQGSRALASSYNAYYGGKNNFVDDYAIQEWGNLVDMSVNWKDRNAMQNAVAGLNTITNLANRYGYAEYLGGSDAVTGINDTLALYTFGNSIYNLTNHWDKLSAAQKVGVTLSTINSGIQAYKGLNTLSNMYQGLSSAATSGAVGIAEGGVAAPALSSPTILSATPVEGAAETSSNMFGTLGQGIGYAAAAYGYYNYCDTLAKNSGVSKGAVLATGGLAAGIGSGRSTAKDRQAGAIAGASAGAAFGSVVPGVGTAIGALVGAITGTIQNSGKFGASREEAHRRLYRDALVQSGIIQRFDEGFEQKGSMMYQLADGQYYNVGKDGSGSRATDINGEVKHYYNKDMIAEGDKVKSSGEVLPYNIDYTCNMDYTGSLLLAPLNALGLGGSNTRDSGEYGQMLGYLTNAVTSNVEREFTQDNYNKMVDNIKAGYERVGITKKQDALDALGLSYMMGNLTDEDYNSFKLGVDILYSNNGYNRAQTLMDQLGRNQSEKSKTEVISDKETVTVDNTEEVIQ